MRRANSSISCWSAWSCCAFSASLAAAGLARSLATSIAATTLVATGNSASRPSTVAARSSPRRQPPRQDPSATSAIKAGKKTRLCVILPRMSSGWARMRFKGEQVWVRADESGQLVLDADGRAEMKYRETDSKSYRPSPGNLLPDRGRRPRATRRPSANAARAAPPKRPARAPSKAPSSGGSAVEIWTDGACSGNPGPMGIGVVVIDGATRREKGEYLGVGTNNIAELTAIERGIDLAGDAGRRMRVYTDSSYAIGVLSKGWKAKANQELIAQAQAAAGAARRGVRQGRRPRRRPRERALRRAGPRGRQRPLTLSIRAA